MSLLKVRNLQCHFKTSQGMIKAVDDVSFEITHGEFLCVIGESGSGKSVTALSIMGLVNSFPGIVGGDIFFEGKNLLDGLPGPEEIKKSNRTLSLWRKKRRKMLRDYRGSKIAIIFQEPVSSLNPFFTVGFQLAEAIGLSGKYSDKEKKNIAIDWLRKVMIYEPEKVVDYYPFELSGGMAQRVMIAIALAGQPSLLIADEPTTSLDPTVQIEILALLKQLQKEFNLSIMLITHDIGIAKKYADKVAVMYAGNIVEYGSNEEIFGSDQIHPYTQGLLNSSTGNNKESRNNFIKGGVPDHFNLPEGCNFYPRCELNCGNGELSEKCKKNEPKKTEFENGHWLKCWKYNSGIK